MATLEVQLLKRHLDIEGIPGKPEQKAQGQDQSPCIDEEVPVVQCGEDPHQQKDQAHSVAQKSHNEEKYTAPEMASCTRPAQEHCPGAAGGVQLRSWG